jgi:hypothetical protein
MGHHHILRVLFMYGLSTIRLLGGLGVEDRHKGRREITILLRVIFCGVWPKTKSVDRNPKTLDELNNRLQILLLQLLLISYGESCKNLCGMLGTVLKSEANWHRSLSALRWRKNCSNRSFLVGGTVI